jgi:hypothetical protein
MEKKISSYNLPIDILDEVEAYATKKNISKSDAVRDLLKTGLAAENSGLYAQPVAQMVREIMRGELGLFREYQEQVIETDAALITDTYKDILSATTGMLMLVLSMFGRADETKDLDALFDVFRTAGRLSVGGYGYTEALETAEQIVADSYSEDGLTKEEALL